MGREQIQEYFSELETTKEHHGYFCSVGEALTIVILGSMCGLRNASQIHQWASDRRVGAFLSEHFGIRAVPCYYWLLCLLKIIKPESLNRCFMKWVQSVKGKSGGGTISFDGKSIRSTGKMDKYENPLHIISAHLAEEGMTLAQKTVDGKSNEIPAMRELLKIMDISGSMVVADALHCQKETAEAIIGGKGDYLLDVKDNQRALKEGIAEYVQDEVLRAAMDSHSVREKNNGRVERRSAYTTRDVTWLNERGEWERLACIGVIHTQCTTKKGTSDEWHYYISSRALTAKELLRHARLEWTVETMHRLLDVRFGEDFCRIEDKNVQQNLNIVRKIVLNTLRGYKNKTSSKRPFSKLMLDCLLDPQHILSFLAVNEN